MQSSPTRNRLIMIVPTLPSSDVRGRHAAEVGDPVWDIATLFPLQGSWTEEQYLSLDTNRLIEFSDGLIEVLPMPTLLHQLIVKFLVAQLDRFIAAGSGGVALFAPLPVKFHKAFYREPDVVYLGPKRKLKGEKYPQGADLVMEVVSEDKKDRARDYERKRGEYAEMGVPEYWIVDPYDRKITVLVLAGKAYREHGVFRTGEMATSVLLAELAISADEVFALGEE